MHNILPVIGSLDVKKPGFDNIMQDQSRKSKLSLLNFRVSVQFDFKSFCVFQGKGVFMVSNSPKLVESWKVRSLRLESRAFNKFWVIFYFFKAKIIVAKLISKGFTWFLVNNVRIMANFERE